MSHPPISLMGYKSLCAFARTDEHCIIPQIWPAQGSEAWITGYRRCKIDRGSCPSLSRHFLPGLTNSCRIRTETRSGAVGQMERKRMNFGKLSNVSALKYERPSGDSNLFNCGVSRCCHMACAVLIYTMCYPGLRRSLCHRGNDPLPPVALLGNRFVVLPSIHVAKSMRVFGGRE